jgi:hydroxyacylglutathione hydrolase
VLIDRSMDPGWLSNAYLVADETGGAAVFVDSGAPLEPLLAAAREWGVEPSHIMRTHGHTDHVSGEDKLGLKVVTGPLEVGGLKIEALPTPGHADDHLAFVVNGEAVFTGDVLFKDSVGGGDFEQIRSSVMDALMALPDETRVLPGHTEETTIGRERSDNPFVRVWTGEEPEGVDPVRVGGRDATLIVWSPDYDGKGKAWVRYENGEDAIVGGSRIERS